MVPVPESKLQANTLHCHNPARGNSHALERGAAAAAGRTPQLRSVEAIGPRPRKRGSTAHPRTRCRRGATGEAACPALVGLCGASSQQSRHHKTQLHFASVGASKTSAENGVASRKSAPGKACGAMPKHTLEPWKGWWGWWSPWLGESAAPFRSKEGHL